ncbi:MAG: hypothetical protein ACPL07_02535 [Candidatus Bathyarchaeia archaeon]
MSAPQYSWQDVITSIQEALIGVLKAIGDTLAQNATVIGQAVIGLGIAYAIYQMARRTVPFLGSFLGRILG